ncbi:MAG TPA: prolipoprotein diacylglyceryl transferase family protein [Thermoanaerobaculia bacterium]|nr:prolipoprotein diacylglyceryl transferase family protein [Thermoanaerobaculia bacterium]
MILHNALELTGYFVGVLLYSWLRARRGDTVSDRARLDVIIGAAIGAATGARLLWWLGEPGVPINQILHGKTIVGGLLGGWIGVELVKKVRGIRSSTGDLFVFPLITAMSIGRIGCFLAGPADHTAGNPSSLPWAIAMGDPVRRHPVALYEIAFLLLFGAALLLLEQRAAFASGDRFKIFLSGYLAFRLAVDFIKPFPVPIFGGLSAIQWACVAGLTYYAAHFARRIAIPTKVTA